MVDYTAITKNLFSNLYPQFDMQIKSIDVVEKESNKKIFVGVEIHKYGLDFSAISEKLTRFSNLTYNIFQV